jgi:hypothetical protein
VGARGRPTDDKDPWRWKRADAAAVKPIEQTPRLVEPEPEVDDVDVDALRLELSRALAKARASGRSSSARRQSYRGYQRHDGVLVRVAWPHEKPPCVEQAHLSRELGSVAWSASPAVLVDEACDGFPAF